METDDVTSSTEIPKQAVAKVRKSSQRELNFNLLSTFCPGAPLHKTFHIVVSLFLRYCVRVAYCLFFCFCPFVLLCLTFEGSRDGAVVRGIVSRQCGSGSIPGLGVI